MSDFTEETLRYLEKLSCIQCDPSEEKQLTTSLKKILDYVELLDEVDTKDVPTFWSEENAPKGALREDEVKDLLDHETYINSVPEKTAGMIRVPHVFSKGETT